MLNDKVKVLKNDKDKEELFKLKDLTKRSVSD